MKSYLETHIFEDKNVEYDFTKCKKPYLLIFTENYSNFHNTFILTLIEIHETTYRHANN
jgi:hypothetical protein